MMHEVSTISLHQFVVYHSLIVLVEVIQYQAPWLLVSVVSSLVLMWGVRHDVKCVNTL